MPSNCPDIWISNSSFSLGGKNSVCGSYVLAMQFRKEPNLSGFSNCLILLKRSSLALRVFLRQSASITAKVFTFTEVSFFSLAFSCSSICPDKRERTSCFTVLRQSSFRSAALEQNSSFLGSVSMISLTVKSMGWAKASL